MLKKSLQNFFLLLLSSTTIFAGGAEISGSEYAGYPGYYLGGQVGAGMVRANNVTANQTTFSVNNNTAVPGGVYAGYKFFPYIALELSFDAFNNYYYTTSTVFTGASSTIRRELYDFALMGKLIAPIDRFYLFAAGGVAAVITEYQHFNNSNVTFVQPKAQVGLGYYVTRHVSIGVSYSRIWGTGQFKPQVASSGGLNFLTINRSTLPDIDLAAVDFTIDL